MSLITNYKKQLSTINTEDTYKEIRCFIISAKQEIYKSVNSAMVEAYWNIGKKTYEVCGENDRAEYGKQVLKLLQKNSVKDSVFRIWEIWDSFTWNFKSATHCVANWVGHIIVY